MHTGPSYITRALRSGQNGRMDEQSDPVVGELSRHICAEGLRPLIQAWEWLAVSP